MKKYDIIVIGAGPAGISASIYIKRSNKSILVLHSGISELEKAQKVDNYYGFINGISGKELYENGIMQAKNLGIEVLEKEIVDIEILENFNFIVKSTNEEFGAKAIVIATGNKKIKPNIKGIDEFDGKGISYCAICDGFFYRGKNVAVIGDGNFALNEAKDLENVAKNIKVLTNGQDVRFKDEFEIDTRKIKEIGGKEKVEFVEFEDGDKIKVDGVFIAQGIASGVNFAKKLGIITKGDNIIVNENMETNVNGIFASGNLTGGLLQVSKAVYEGAKAGLQAVKYLNDIEKNEKSDIIVG